MLHECLISTDFLDNAFNAILQYPVEFTLVFSCTARIVFFTSEDHRWGYRCICFTKYYRTRCRTSTMNQLLNTYEGKLLIKLPKVFT